MEKHNLKVQFSNFSQLRSDQVEMGEMLIAFICHLNHAMALTPLSIRVSYKKTPIINKIPIK